VRSFDKKNKISPEKTEGAGKGGGKWGIRMRTFVRTAVAAAIFFSLAGRGTGQPNLDQALLNKIPAVTGHEQALSKALAEALKDFHPTTDNLANVYITVGSGAPHRLIATAIDEPGYVVSQITADGYLRVQRLPQAAPNPVFDSLSFAQPVIVVTRNSKEVPGVFAGLSVHLAPGRPNPPKMNYVEDLYVDIGAKSTEEVRAAGVDVLDPVALKQGVVALGDSGRAGPGSQERTACEALLRLLGRIRESKVTGTTTVAFVTQQWLGGRGLNRLLTEIHPTEMVLVGRIAPVPPADKDAKVEEPKPGSGVLLGAAAEAKEGAKSFEGQLKELAEKEQIPLQVVTATPPRIVGFARAAALPERFAQLGVALRWPVTPAETAANEDGWRLERLLESYLEISKPPGGSAGGIGSGGGEHHDIVALTEAYGASGHESAIRDMIVNQLDPRMQKKVTTDAAGNLVLHLGDERKNKETPRIVFVAHMDEIGYEVKKIDDDGRLQVDVLGGGYQQYFLGHVVLVHKKDRSKVGGVLELPSGWDKPGFEWPSGPRSMDEPAHIYVGTKTKEETAKLGIAEGDFVTIPKEYRPLLGTRANARSFDDRAGCAALIAAANSLGPDLPGRDVTFVWSTEEEVGLKGAAAFAEQAAKEGRTPDFVFAVDTFVSSDSPLESKRFADAEIGKGFVVRAVDNSNIVPVQYVDRVVALAKENGIAAQYGVTGGGNDGSVFLRHGSVDVALGWPLRYSHSPGEVIDTKDLEALGKIVAVLAKSW
jgi:putative aminopeptidase FrvX